jgi:predicted ATPase
VISRLRIQRFKCYRDQSLALRHLTVLAGVNGGGKSTVLQAVLLLRDAAYRGRASCELNGPFGLDLGEALDVLHHEAEPEEGIRLTVDDDSAQYVLDMAVPTDRSRSLPITAALLPAAAAILGQRGRSFMFLSADRLGPRDVYEATTLDPEDLNVGCRGEAVAQVLVQADRMIVANELAYPGTDAIGAQRTVPSQTELWLSEIVRPIQIDAKWIPGTSVVTLRFRESGFQGEWTRPANTGFGLTSILPVVVAGLTVAKGGMLVVENPEVHLHPRGQSEVGAFLARIAASGVQVLVETHSDHVLNGIRRAVACDHVLPAEKVVVHFFGVPENTGSGRLSIESLDLKPNGDISTWPRNFFDQIEDDLARLARSRRPR